MIQTANKMIVQRHLFVLLIFGISLVLNSCHFEDKTESLNMDLLNRLYTEGVNKQNLEVIESSLAENYLRHCQAMPPELQKIEGKEQMMVLFKGHFSAFPDWKEEIKIKAVDGNTIAYISKGTGTQTGQAGNLPPKNRKCDVDHVIIHRFENGKIAETWVSWDNLTLLGQLGHYPPVNQNDREN